MAHPKLIALAAAAAFAFNKQLNELHVTEDGNAFMPHLKSLAENHARQMKLPKPVLVKREEVSAQIVLAEQELATKRAAKEAKKKAAADAAAKSVEAVPAAPAPPSVSEAGATQEPGAAMTNDAEGAAGAYPPEVINGVVRGIDLVGEEVTIKKKKVSGVEILQRAFVDSGLTTDQWNEQSDEAIMDRCFATIDALKAA